MQKAEVFATVSSEEKAKYLTNTFGIPASRIFNSRQRSMDDLVAEIMTQTSHRGVDLVLNSLSGDLLHDSVRTITFDLRLVKLTPGKVEVRCSIWEHA